MKKPSEIIIEKANEMISEDYELRENTDLEYRLTKIEYLLQCILKYLDEEGK